MKRTGFVRLEFVQIGENCILKEEYGTDVFSWQDRKEAIDKWFDGLLTPPKDRLFSRTGRNPQV